MPDSSSRYWCQRLLKLLKLTLTKNNIEHRGIARVPPEERYDANQLGAFHSFLFWFSSNLKAVMVVLGMLGPDLYQLTLLESSVLGICGALLGVMILGH